MGVAGVRHGDTMLHIWRLGWLKMGVSSVLVLRYIS